MLCLLQWFHNNIRHKRNIEDELSQRETESSSNFCSAYSNIILRCYAWLIGNENNHTHAQGQRKGVSLPSSPSHQFQHQEGPGESRQAIKELFAQVLIEATPPYNSSDPLIMQEGGQGIFFSFFGHKVLAMK